MQWTDIKIITDKKFEDIFDFVSAEVCPMGVQIEDYSDLEQQVEEIAHIDLIEQDLLEKNRSEIIVHHYISPELDAQNARLTLENRLDAKLCTSTRKTGKQDGKNTITHWTSAIILLFAQAGKTIKQTAKC